jgi:hypothetical protein
MDDTGDLVLMSAVIGLVEVTCAALILANPSQMPFRYAPYFLV